MDFSSSKIIAGIGSLIFGSIIGIILVLLGMKGLSEHYKDKHIYDGLVASVIFFILSTIFFFIGILSLFILIGIPFLIASFVFALLAARKFKLALNALSECSGEHLFNTAGTLIWIGAILTIIAVGFALIWIGFIIAAIGFFTIKETPSRASDAYSTSPTYGSAPPPTTQPPPTTSTASDTKSNFCPNCGTPVLPEATFCAHCGKQI